MIRPPAGDVNGGKVGSLTERAAKRALTKALRDLDQGAYIEPSGETVAEFGEKWLHDITPTVRPSTHHSYARNLHLHVLSRIGQVPLARVDGEILNSLYADLLTSGRQDGAGLSPCSVRYVHTIVGRMLGDAVRWNRLVRNPAKAVDPPRASSVGGRSVTAWSAETLGDFLGRSTAYGDRYYPLWVTLATGARKRRGARVALARC